MTPEGKVQRKIIDHLELDGWFVTKLMQTSTNGIPDLLAVKKNKNLWIEVKTEKGKLAPLQVYRIDQLKNFGQEVLVPYGIAHWKEIYSQYKELKRL